MMPESQNSGPRGDIHCQATHSYRKGYVCNNTGTVGNSVFHAVHPEVVE
jgi:hypothetical protein